MDDTPIPDDRIPELVSLGLCGAMLVHELKQPIFSIRAMAQLAIARGNFTGDVLRDILHQIDVIDEYVDYFSSSKGGEPVLFSAMDGVSRAVRLLKPRADQQGVTMTLVGVTDSVMILGRPNSLFQSVMNLLANAIGILAGQGGTVEVTVEVSEYLVICVEDNGPGVPDGDYERIFEPYVTTRSESGGTGLGLYLTRQLVSGLGGQVSGMSSERGGARFEIKIPIER